jgi:two-component system cell cycle response regulator DivK
MVVLAQRRVTRVRAPSLGPPRPSQSSFELDVVVSMPLRTGRRRRSSDTSGRRERVESLSPDRRHEKPVVLVVDDDPDARFIYSSYLRAMGCEVFLANDGRVALEKATDLLPDIIVMDLAMPRVDGWEAIRRLRESSWTRQLPVVAVSAVPLSREAAFDAGCDAYLSKPCDPQVVWAQICALLKLPGAGVVQS